MTEYYPHELDDINHDDLSRWLLNDELEGLVEENSGGIIGYLNRDHCDRIAQKLNSAHILLEACQYVVDWHREHDSGEGELFGLDFVTTCIGAIRKATQ